ncbi:CASP-like protein 4A4, partial [Hibiscus syriacus]|uniref:CASP-like protein 4A4 n=1 Tax=Hibiscus syriacus TaxID=106335 RepID=UPI0019243F56
KKKREYVLAIARRITPADSPVTFNSQAQQRQPFPTPSPFSFSVASTGWSSRSSINHHSTLLLRFSVLLFSFISALILAAPSTKKKHQPSLSFTDYPELIYCFIVASIALLYAALQLFKGVCDIAHRGILISDKASDYVSFVLDQLVGYLLVSSASVAVPIIRQVERGTPLRKGAVVSTTMSFATFIVMAICAVLSGYKLCKRIGW